MPANKYVSPTKDADMEAQMKMLLDGHFYRMDQRPKSGEYRVVEVDPSGQSKSQAKYGLIGGVISAARKREAMRHALGADIDIRIASMREEGRTMAHIAKVIGCSESYVRSVLMARKGRK